MTISQRQLADAMWRAESSAENLLSALDKEEGMSETTYITIVVTIWLTSGAWLIYGIIWL